MKIVYLSAVFMALFIISCGDAEKSISGDTKENNSSKTETSLRGFGGKIILPLPNPGITLPTITGPLYVCKNSSIKKPCFSFFKADSYLANNRWSDRTSMNNSISSIKVKKGYEAKLCTESYNRGICKTFKAETRDRTWNLRYYSIDNKVSSLSYSKIIIDPCKNQSCSGHGTCKVSKGKAICSCDSGYYHTSGNLVCKPENGKTCGNDMHWEGEPGNFRCEPDYKEESCNNISTKPENSVWKDPEVTYHFENGSWVMTGSCIWQCDGGFEKDENSCKLLPMFATISISKACEDYPNHDLDCNQENVESLKSCRKNKKRAFEKCRDSWVDKNRDTRKLIEKQNERVINFANTQKGTVLDNLEGKMAEIEARRKKIKAREKDILSKRSALENIKKINAAYVKKLNERKEDFTKFSKKFKAFKEKWVEVQKELNDIVKEGNSTEDRKRLIKLNAIIFKLLDDDYIEGFSIYNEALFLKEVLIKIKEEYEKEIGKHESFISENGLKILDETKVPINFLARIMVYTDERKELMKNECEALMRDLKSRRELLAVSQAKEAVRDDILRAQDLWSASEFLSKVTGYIDGLWDLPEKSPTMGLYYFLPRYRKLTNFIKLKPICDDKDNEFMTWKQTGCVGLLSEIDKAERYLSKSIPDFVEAGLYDLELKAYEDGDEIQFALVTEAIEAIERGDIEQAVSLYDKTLRMEDEK